MSEAKLSFQPCILWSAIILRILWPSRWWEHASLERKIVLVWVFSLFNSRSFNAWCHLSIYIESSALESFLSWVASNNYYLKENKLIIIL